MELEFKRGEDNMANNFINPKEQKRLNEQIIKNIMDSVDATVQQHKNQGLERNKAFSDYFLSKNNAYIEDLTSQKNNILNASTNWNSFVEKMNQEREKAIKRFDKKNEDIFSERIQLLSNPDKAIQQFAQNRSSIEAMGLPKRILNLLSQGRDIKDIINKKEIERITETQNINKKIKEAQKTGKSIEINKKLFDSLDNLSSKGMLTEDYLIKALSAMQNNGMTGKMSAEQRKEILDPIGQTSVSEKEIERNNITGGNGQFQALYNRYIAKNRRALKLQAQKTKAQDYFGVERELQAPQNANWTVSNPRKEQLAQLKKVDPKSHAHITSGVASYTDKNFYFDKQDKSAMPSMDVEVLKSIDEKLGKITLTEAQKQASSIKYNIDTKTLANAKKLIAIDFETIGEKGQSNFAPTQMGIYNIGGKGKPQEYFFKLEGESRKYIEDAISKAKNKEILTEGEKRSLMWLRDIKEEQVGKSKRLKALHREIPKDADVLSYMTEIEEGAARLIGKSGTGNVFSNRITYSQANLKGKLEKAGWNPNKPSETQIVGHNIGLFDLKVFGNKGMSFDEGYLDTLDIALQLYKVGVSKK